MTEVARGSSLDEISMKHSTITPKNSLKYRKSKCMDSVDLLIKPQSLSEISESPNYQSVTVIKEQCLSMKS